MADQEHLRVLQQSVELWNMWRNEHPETIPNLIEANLIGADLNFADLIDAYLFDADLSRATLSRANLSGANLSGATLSYATLIGADLNFADLSYANLIGADLSGADLTNTNLREADLSRATLSRANLIGANLIGANLIGANLIGANLIGANLIGANLIGANLSGADLNFVDLSGADLSRADLSGATVGRTTFGNLDLQTVKGLEMIDHLGPSTIGTDTLERSGGHLPDQFLRGAGLSDTFITYLHSLIHAPIEYYTCFISYSSKDEVFAKRLHNDLQQEGVRCWFAPEDMDVGDKIQKRIEESIRLYDKLLLILSEHSITSNWVAYEVERALNKEPHGIPNVLYPVRVDQTIMTCSAAWAREIKSTRHIGNFENWTDPIQYEENFKRLLRALNTKKDQLPK